MRNAASRFLVGAVLATTVVLGGPANAAATLNFAGGTGNLTAGQTNYADFDTTFGNIASLTGSSGLYSGNIGGITAQPRFGDQGDAYYTVLTGGSATFSFAAPVASFGFDLGSADTYNLLTVGFLGGGSQTFAGVQLNPPGPANGDQTASFSNGRVTIYGGDMGRITSATFSSTGNSFEFDNIGIGAVPEPATWGLFIMGFGVMGSSMRRRSAKFGALRAAFA